MEIECQPPFRSICKALHTLLHRQPTNGDIIIIIFMWFVDRLPINDVAIAIWIMHCQCKFARKFAFSSVPRLLSLMQSGTHLNCKAVSKDGGALETNWCARVSRRLRDTVCWFVELHVPYLINAIVRSLSVICCPYVNETLFVWVNSSWE